MALPLVLAAVGGVEGASAAVGVGTAAAVPAIEAANVAAGAVKTAETVMSAVKTGEAIAGAAEAGVTEAAKNAASFIEEGLKNGVEPQSMLEKLAEGTELKPSVNDVVGPDVEVANTSSTNVSPEAQNFIDVETRTSLEKWDQEHPIPDKETNPDAYEQWSKNRFEAEQDFINDIRTELTMKDWEKENPEPDKSDSSKHEEWEKKRSEQEEKVREKVKKETKKSKEDEIAEVMRKIERLRLLYQERMDIVDGINAIKRQPEKTDEDKKDLARFQVRKSVIDSEINVIETDLKAKAGRSAPYVSLMIASALATMTIYKIGQQEGFA